MTRTKTITSHVSATEPSATEEKTVTTTKTAAPHVSATEPTAPPEKTVKKTKTARAHVSATEPTATQEKTMKKAKAAAPHVSATEVSVTEENTMSTPNPIPASIAPPVVPAVASSTATATPTPALITAPVLQPVIKGPPASANIPEAPSGTTNSNGDAYRGVLPKKMEQAAMPDVLEELARFSEYVQVFGKTAPPLAYVIQTFAAASQWTSMRVKTNAWELFTRSQEGAAWIAARKIMQGLSPALSLVVQTDPTLAQQFPALVRLFGVSTAIARRAATSRAVNKKDIAEGRPPSRGKAAKRAKKLASAAAKVSTSAAAGTTVPSSSPAAIAPAVVTAASVPPTANGASH